MINKSDESQVSERSSVSVLQKGFGKIGKIPMQDKRLNVISKAIYAYLCSYTGKNNSCYPTQTMICGDLRISKDTLSKYIKELVSFGYVVKLQERDKGKYSKNIYVVSESVTLPEMYLPKTITVSENTVSDITVSDDTVSD